MFKDEDIKQLRDCANGYGNHSAHIVLHCFKEKRVVIEALLARLEAAEAVCREFKKFEDEPRVCTTDGKAWLLDRHMYIDLLKAFDAWLKSKGTDVPR